MNKLLSIFLLPAALLVACSETTHTNSSSVTDDNGSYAEDSFKSSSSISERLDIDYRDTISAGDTMNFYMELAIWDTVTVKVPKDSTGKKTKDSTYVEKVCHEDIVCIDSTKSTVSFFLGDFPKGTRISVTASTSGMENDTIRIRGEKNGDLRTLMPVYNSQKKDSVYSNYMHPGSGADMLFNSFVAFNDDFYYLDLAAEFDTSAHLRVKVDVDTAYYNYTGDSAHIDIDLRDTVRGILVIGESPKKVEVAFKVETGFSVNLSVQGYSINKYELIDKNKNVYSPASDTLDTLLVTNDSSEWTLSLYPSNVVSFLDGPFATFEAATRFRRLNQGEYLAKPDSIVYPGDTLTIVRPANDSTKYYLRQDHYVWLADLKKGDSLVVYHEMEGYCKYMECKGTPRASYWLIDAKGDSIGTISSLEHSFKAKKDGPVYLRYLQLNSKALTDSNLTLRTFIQRPGSLDSLKFYNEKKDETYSSKRVKAGDSVVLSDFAFQTVPYKTSYNVKWFVPCEDLTTLGNAAYISQLENCKGEQEISSFYLIAQNDATDKDARLIAQSMADPLMRDTLTINVR